MRRGTPDDTEQIASVDDEQCTQVRANGIILSQPPNDICRALSHKPIHKYRGCTSDASGLNRSSHGLVSVGSLKCQKVNMKRNVTILAATLRTRICHRIGPTTN